MHPNPAIRSHAHFSRMRPELVAILGLALWAVNFGGPDAPTQPSLVEMQCPVLVENYGIREGSSGAPRPLRLLDPAHLDVARAQREMILGESMARDRSSTPEIPTLFSAFSKKRSSSPATSQFAARNRHLNALDESVRLVSHTNTSIEWLGAAPFVVARQELSTRGSVRWTLHIT
jgi:hypothetical protein